jgi:hypothetical protein
MSEKDFQNELIRIAPLYKCAIIDIPDIPPLNRYGKVLKKGEKPAISRKLPFDCLLVTPQQNYLIEAKYQNNTLLPHQLATQSKVNAINDTYYVLRKKILKKGIIYSIEQGDFKFTANDITKIFAFFNDPREYISQKAMLDQLIPEKKKKKLNRTRC